MRRRGEDKRPGEEIVERVRLTGADLGPQHRRLKATGVAKIDAGHERTCVGPEGDGGNDDGTDEACRLTGRRMCCKAAGFCGWQIPQPVHRYRFAFPLYWPSLTFSIHVIPAANCTDTCVAGVPGTAPCQWATPPGRYTVSCNPSSFMA